MSEEHKQKYGKKQKQNKKNVIMKNLFFSRVQYKSFIRNFSRLAILKLKNANLTSANTQMT